MAARIAVVSLAARFPGAHDVETLWSNLLEGRRHFRQISHVGLRQGRIHRRQS